MDPRLSGRYIFNKDDSSDLKLITGECSDSPPHSKPLIDNFTSYYTPFVVDAAYYAPYALAAYTHLMYLFMNPGCGLCKLCQFCACSGSGHGKSDFDLAGDVDAERKRKGKWGACCSLG